MEKPLAFIMDIDGTTADNSGRGPFEYHLLKYDPPFTDMIDLGNILMDAGYCGLYVSGREDTGYSRSDTVDYLRDHGARYTEFHMREHRDFRSDDIVKEEIYNLYIKPFYTVRYVFDDRNKVVSMWRKRLGLRTLQVAESPD